MDLRLDLFVVVLATAYLGYQINRLSDAAIATMKEYQRDLQDRQALRHRARGMFESFADLADAKRAEIERANKPPSF